MKIQDLTNEQANHWAAKAQKWKKAHLAGNHNWPEYWVSGTDLMHKVEGYTPTTNPAQWAELIERLGIVVTPLEVWWWAEQYGSENGKVGDTPGRAVVNAVIASVFGESVPEGE